jgi:basic membrane protein A and related proteins
MRRCFFAFALLLAGLAWGKPACAQPASAPAAFLFIPLAKDDFNYSQSVYEGAAKLRALGYRIDFQDNADKFSPEAMLETIGRKHEEGIHLFILGGNEFSAVTTQAAKKYPKAYFATLSGDATGENVINYCLDCLSPGGDMSGKLALELSVSKIIGYVGGVSAVDGPEAAAFKKTILAGDPKAQVLIDWTENWSDLVGAAKLARVQIAKGADVIYATANTGVIAGADNWPGVKIIGALVDVSSLSRNVAASVVINTHVVYRHFIHSVQGGTFRGGIHKVTSDEGVWSVVWPK